MLPIKPRSRALIAEISQVLEPNLPQITEAWRRRVQEEFAFSDERVLTALERLSIASGSKFFAAGDFAGFFENLHYYGTRLAKLQVDTRAVARSLELEHDIYEPHLAQLDAEKRVEARAALEMLSSQAFITVSGAYFDTQSKESAALLAALDAELLADNLEALLQRVLEITTSTFNATLGLLLLRDSDGDILRAKASFGWDGPRGMEEELRINMGQGFLGTIAQTGEPALLPDLDRCGGELSPILRNQARALWGMPLKHAEQTIGVLLIGFVRPYEWLPTERELLRAIADRSALAIDRARMTDALREREARIAELSGHLLQAQEEERKRISRELHDETGQALMVIRLYLGMLEGTLTGRTAKSKVRETVTVVDRTIEGLRRIIARLAPLVLQELGLVAAIRKEAKDLAKSTGIKARVYIDEKVGRLADDTETAIYRVVQEALHNVARHSQAKSVNVQMAREGNEVLLLVEDDGAGISKPGLSRERPTFGLEGMRERIGMLGGRMKIISAKGKGTQLQIRVPAERNGLETPLPITRVKVASKAEPAEGEPWLAPLKKASGGPSSRQ
jgi:signal transduction histidine kinase